MTQTNGNSGRATILVFMIEINVYFHGEAISINRSPNKETKNPPKPHSLDTDTIHTCNKHFKILHCIEKKPVIGTILSSFMTRTRSEHCYYIWI